MEKFLQKMQADLDNKIFNCISGQSIVKPFSQVYEVVREKPKKKNVESKPPESCLSEDSIYRQVIKDFLKEHPDLIRPEE